MLIPMDFHLCCLTFALGTSRTLCAPRLVDASSTDEANLHEDFVCLVLTKNTAQFYSISIVVLQREIIKFHDYEDETFRTSASDLLLRLRENGDELVHKTF